MLLTVFFIGNYDADGLTATSLAYPLQMLLIAFAVGTAVGVNSFVSRKLGEKNFVQANDGATARSCNLRFLTM